MQNSRPLPASSDQNAGVAYLNDHQAADYTGLSVATLRRDRFQKRGFPYVKLGRSVRYRREDIDRVMSVHLIEPKSA